MTFHSRTSNHALILNSNPPTPTKIEGKPWIYSYPNSKAKLDNLLINRKWIVLWSVRHTSLLKEYLPITESLRQRYSWITQKKKKNQKNQNECWLARKNFFYINCCRQRMLLEDLPEAMYDRDRRIEWVREIRVINATWWWRWYNKCHLNTIISGQTKDKIA